MKKFISILCLSLSLSSFAYEGTYKIEVPGDLLVIKVSKNGSSKLLSKPGRPYAVASMVEAGKLDLTISWMNDGSPELARIILEKDKMGEVKVGDQFTVFNDGDPMLCHDGAELKSVELTRHQH